MIIRRALQSSAIRSNPTLGPSIAILYLAASSHFEGPGSFWSVISLPRSVHLPAIGGQPGSPPSVNVPAGSNCKRKLRISSGDDGGADCAVSVVGIANKTRSSRSARDIARMVTGEQASKLAGLFCRPADLLAR